MKQKSSDYKNNRP